MSMLRPTLRVLERDAKGNDRLAGSLFVTNTELVDRLATTIEREYDAQLSVVRGATVTLRPGGRSVFLDNDTLHEVAAALRDRARTSG